jgi:hypothetical protein
MKIDINKIIKIFPTEINSKFPYTKEMLYSFEPLSKLNKNNEKEIYQNQLTGSDEPEIIYKLNDFNYRCENFIKDHSGKHIVFAGCSVTFGEGLEIEETWSKKLYDLINKDFKCSGYFNLALPGSSITHQIVLLFKYFKNYGNPDIVFLNSPGLVRFYSYSSVDNLFFDSFYNNESKKMINLISYQYYLMLDQYCKSNKIKLYCFSWKDKKENHEDLYHDIEDTFINFDSFYPIKTKEILYYCKEYVFNNKGKKYLIKARDNDHHGIAFHEYWAKFIYEKYLNSL